MRRRTFLMTSLLPAILPPMAEASVRDPRQTYVLQRPDIEFQPWQVCRPAAGRRPCSTAASTVQVPIW
jgi:hypothetical protein